MNKTKEPIVVFCDVKHKDLYDNLLKEELFSGQTLSTIFITAMVLGFYRDRRIPLIRQKKDIIRTEYFNEQQKDIMKALAVATENNLEVLADKKKVLSIAEEYANGGIKILDNLIFGSEFGSPDKRLESELQNITSSIIKQLK